MGKVAIGIVIGVTMIPLMRWALHDRWDGWRDVLFLLAVGAIMWGVSLIAAIGPARRALRIQPTEALKAE